MECPLSIDSMLIAFLHQPSLSPHRKPRDEELSLYITGEKAGAVKDSTEDRQMRAALMGLGHPEPTSKGLDKPSLMSLNWDCVKTKRWQGVGFLT